MTFFFQYLLRLSLSFAVMYLFYAIALRRLTFYNYNRWYLLSYSMLCFIIPLVHISSGQPSVFRSAVTITNNPVVRMIPSITFTAPSPAETFHIWSIYQIILFLFFAGVLLMLIRILFQLLSYKRLTRNAEIISDDGTIKLYQIDKEIVPFSFGNSIFINRDMHDGTSLKEILQHEFVHVKQKHTLDILWCEMLCIFNWYNPFVWLIRKAIRENLEFIADDKVVQTGISKQRYQYLLLRVMGNNNFSITNKFNFSSLKKRITMMNKIKTAKIHLLRFLFLIPLLGALLVSFRDVIKEKSKDIITISGIVVDGYSLQPVVNVLVEDSIDGVKTITDKNGFYTLNLKNNGRRRYSVKLSKNGFRIENFPSFFLYENVRDYSFPIVNFGIKSDTTPDSSANTFVSIDGQKHLVTYKKALESLKEHINIIKSHSLDEQEDNSRGAVKDNINKLQNQKVNKNSQAKSITYFGVIVNAENNQPIRNAIIINKASNTSATTDEHGFYKIKFTSEKNKSFTELSFSTSARGYNTISFGTGYSQSSKGMPEINVCNIGLPPSGYDVHKGFVDTQSAITSANMTYEYAVKKLKDYTSRDAIAKRLAADTAHIAFYKDGKIFVFGPDFYLSADSTLNSKVYVNDTLMTIHEINSRYTVNKNIADVRSEKGKVYITLKNK